jgi:hypothetical protein
VRNSSGHASNDSGSFGLGLDLRLGIDEGSDSCSLLSSVCYRRLPGGDGAYYSIDGYPLRDGLRAAIGEHG